jgi:hypothetical protein
VRTRGLLVLCVAIAALKGGIYWIASYVERPMDPPSTIAIYRAKDIHTFPIIKALAELNLGEPSIFERRGSGLLAERFVPWVAHAVAYRLFGVPGFALADVVITLLYFWALLTLLRRAGISPVVTYAAALALTAGAISNFGNVSVHAPGVSELTLYFWGLRLPRPFFSEPFLLLSVACLLALPSNDRGSRRVWTWLAITSALLFHSDPYAFVAIAFAGCLWVGAVVLRSIAERGTMILRDVLHCVVIWLLCSLPIAIQLLLAQPDLLIRQGEFTVSRTAPLFLPKQEDYVLGALLMLGAAFIDWSARYLLPPAAATIRTRALRLFALLSLTALLALPATSFLLGSTVQAYHFQETFSRITSLLVLMIGVNAIDLLPIALERALRPLHGREAVAAAVHGIVQRTVVVTAVVISLLMTTRFARAMPAYERHMRPEFPEWRALPTYRRDFVQLARELESERYKDDVVLGTFDHQLWSWWVTFRPGSTFFSDAMITTLRGSEIERRLMLFCKVLGLNARQFEELINHRVVNIFWLAHDKYQASQAHTFAPLSEYAPEERAAIDETSILSSWAVAIPDSERQRLSDKFQRVQPAGERLDLIVLTKDAIAGDFHPAGDGFALTYENDTFRVWQKRRAF